MIYLLSALLYAAILFVVPGYSYYRSTASKASKFYVDKTYVKSKNDILAAFLERGLRWCSYRGVLGAISSRKVFYSRVLSTFREEVLENIGYLHSMVDLGVGVLEAAVETAAYIINTTPRANSDTLFIRTLLTDDKATTILDTIAELGKSFPNEFLFIINPKSFSKLSSSPYCYWVNSQTIELLSKYPILEGTSGTVRVGLQTGDDWRFLRMLWEIDPTSIVFPPSSTLIDEKVISSVASSQLISGKTWVPFSKTDAAAPWYSPITQVVEWENNGKKLKNFYDENGKQRSVIRNENCYYKPGFSYMLRTTRLVPYIVPAGVIPTAGRAQVFSFDENHYSLLGYCASNMASAIARFSGESFSRPLFQASMVQNLPAPSFPANLIERISKKINDEVELRRSFIQGYEPYQEFKRPAFLDNTIYASTSWSFHTLIGNDLEIQIAESFQLTRDQLDKLERDVREASLLREVLVLDSEMDDEDDEKNSSSQELVDSSTRAKMEGLTSYCVGVIFGRWDVRIGLNIELAPKLSHPFSPVPVCPPGMLIGSNGLPASSGNIVSEEWMKLRLDVNSLPPVGSVTRPTISDEKYPFSVDWDGVLTEDTDHSDDIVHRVRDVMELLYKDKAEAIEQEVCQILGVKELRTYFRNSGEGGFWLDHVDRYSKSRRKAPIYWLLQSSKRSYGLWLYYHRLDKDILYKALVNYVEPKLKLEQDRLYQLQAQRQEGDAGKESRQLGRQFEKQESLVSEIQDFHDKLKRATNLHLDPDLNDGVVLNIAPLWELVPWPEAKRYWEELKQGKYEWSSIGKQLREKGLVK